MDEDEDDDEGDEGEEEIRLNHYNREEWWDVCQRVCPHMTREEYDKNWDVFVFMMTRGTLQ